MKKIIHIDLDYFFAQVELLTRPDLKDKPVAIAGRGKRSVLCTCNYVAREFGLRSAMSLAQAEKKCPSVIIIPPDFIKYKKASEKFFNILNKYTDEIEKVSLDEAYLDITDCELYNNDGNQIAKKIREEIYEKLNLTASIGLSYNKFLAKIGSDLFKPNGMAILRADNIESKIAHFPVKRIQGVGQKLNNKMKKYGLRTLKDLQQKNKLDLINLFGPFGETLYNLSRGIDKRDVKSSRERKSLSVERTFEDDKMLDKDFFQYVDYCYDELEARLKKLPNKVKSLNVKIKYSDFSIQGKEIKENKISKVKFYDLVHKIHGDKKIRLIGLGVKFHSIKNKDQLLLPL